MKKYKIGYTTGVYDMFHVGHLNILKRAKEQCEYLIVGISTDEVVMSYKNKRPIIPFDQRCAIVEAIKYVDIVVPQSDMNKLEAVKRLGANVVFVGSDWQGSSQWLEYERLFFEVGCTVEYLSHTDGISSTMLREKIKREEELK